MSATSWTVAQTALVCLGISGILSHRLYFIQGEHHLKAPQYLAAWFSSMLVIITILNLTDFKVLQYTVLANCAFLGPLFGSIVIYRTLQHPLRDFNGPRLASITKIWHLAHMFRTSNHLFLDRLVKEYGRFVRTGEFSLFPYLPYPLPFVRIQLVTPVLLI
jgi:tryprostatin B 6-hydroxylase